ncbi:hypothetical protein [Gottfriedia acidiceleris]|uniref:hypothetical protein n=1 Tax=Gottfriedia acidiceleris TaxID=371036 RepID=UPI00101D3F2C|nr:hypothetical protein [Gottfriedia acidiceleris]
MPKGYMRYLAICAMMGGVFEILSQIGFDIWGYGSEKDMVFVMVINLVQTTGDLLILLSLVSLFLYSYKKKPGKIVAIGYVVFFIGLSINLSNHLGEAFNTISYLNFLHSYPIEGGGEGVSTISAPLVELTGLDRYWKIPYHAVESLSFLIPYVTFFYVGVSSFIQRTLPRLCAIFLIVFSLCVFSPISHQFKYFIWGFAFILIGRAVYREDVAASLVP